MERSYTMLKGVRLPESDKHTYKLMGLPHGEDFRCEASYDVLYASWLKVHGVGFGAASFEFSEADRDVLVYQPSEHGSAHIKFEGV